MEERDMTRVFLFILAVCLLFTAGCGDDDNQPGGPLPGAQPTISSITPSQVSRGQQHVSGRITGTNLSGVTSVNLGEGITLEQFTGVSSGEIEIRYTVSGSASPGQRTISVTTSGGTASSTSALTVNENQAPTAKFNVSPTAGAKNTLFTFDATGSTDPGSTVATYKWDFGDGQTGNGRVVTHRFSRGGTFTVTLTVTDSNNASNSISRQIEVASGSAPVVKYTVSPQSGDIDTLFRFDASATTDPDGTIVRFEWVFDDGDRATGPTVEHRFRQDGLFNVEVTVTDNDGLTSSLAKDIRVEKFNEAAATAEMADVVTKFFVRYSKLDTLDAERIVEGWSEAPDCPGRDREIRIIQEQQQTIAKTNAEVIGEFDVLIRPDHVTANVNVLAEFTWTEKDGTQGNSQAVHDFAFRFEEGQWLICNFQLIKDDEPTILP